jgi:BirA family transcriptional regulator, biotin operon repressor / biotin---[acetyl-CoA-carboxylase] ligase
VLVADKKICGVLVESQLRGGDLSAVVIGVGLNLRTKHFPDELAVTATSIAALGGDVPEREQLLVEVLVELARYLQRVERAGPSALASELERYDALNGRRVDIDGVIGTARGLDPKGRLIVVDDGGTDLTFVSGHVRLL